MIKLDSVNKKFNPGTINEVYSLREVSLEIREGEFVTVIGTNGSGKYYRIPVISLLLGMRLLIKEILKELNISRGSFRIPLWELLRICQLPKTSSWQF
jgi:ABC-type uncharacterized transport system ATPase component